MWCVLGLARCASVLLSALLALGCSQNSSGIVEIDALSPAGTGGSGACIDGAQQCPCRVSGASCDPGLACDSGVCVLLTGTTPNAAEMSVLNDLPAPTATAPSQVAGVTPAVVATASAAPTASSTATAAPPPVEVPRGSNMVMNGDFSLGISNWTVDDGAGNPVAHTVLNGELCVEVSAAVPFVSVRWPVDSVTGASLSGGNTYQMTYDAWADDPSAVVLETKIGSANAPFTSHFAVEVSLDLTRDSHAHAFNTRSTSTSGVAFELSHVALATRVCFDDVVLRWP